MEKVVHYSEEVETYLNQLIDILFEKEYFGFKEDAQIYVAKIKWFIDDNISVYPPKKVPIELKEFGEKYILYKASPQTTWYIFYIQDEHRFLIKFITNNHTDIIQNFNL